MAKKFRFLLQASKARSMAMRPAVIHADPKDRRTIHGPVFSLKAITKHGRASIPGNPPITTSRRLQGGSGDELSDEEKQLPLLIFGVKDGEMRLGIDGDRSDPKAVKHDSLFDGASELQAAGEIRIEDGRITQANDKSGTYGCANNGRHQKGFRTAFEKAVQVAGTQIAAGALVS